MPELLRFRIYALKLLLIQGLFLERMVTFLFKICAYIISRNRSSQYETKSLISFDVILATCHGARTQCFHKLGQVSMTVVPYFVFITTCQNW